MLKFVTKKLYWSLLDRGLEQKLKTAKWPWHLKSIQDLVAFSYLESAHAQQIAEIGGGNSRILPALSRKNTCTNIEKFGGQDGGPSKSKWSHSRRVKIVKAFVGEFSEQLAADHFDLIFSVSVVEHIANPQLPEFIRDCHRILRPGGTMVHLVDMYLAPERTAYNKSRFQAYNKAFSSQLFEPIGKTIDPDNDRLEFDPSYCSNPDNIMYQWNQVNSDLRSLRENAQSVTLVWAGSAQSIQPAASPAPSQ